MWCKCNVITNSVEYHSVFFKFFSFCLFHLIKEKPVRILQRHLTSDKMDPVSFYKGQISTKRFLNVSFWVDVILSTSTARVWPQLDLTKGIHYYIHYYVIIMMSWIWSSPIWNQNDVVVVTVATVMRSLTLLILISVGFLIPISIWIVLNNEMNIK